MRHALILFKPNQRVPLRTGQTAPACKQAMGESTEQALRSQCQCQKRRKSSTHSAIPDDQPYARDNISFVCPCTKGMTDNTKQVTLKTNEQKQGKLSSLKIASLMPRSQQHMCGQLSSSKARYKEVLARLHAMTRTSRRTIHRFSLIPSGCEWFPTN